MSASPARHLVVGLAPGGRGLAALRLAVRLAGETGTVEVVVVNDSIDEEAVAFSAADVMSSIFERARAAWRATAEEVEAEARKVARKLGGRLSFAHEEGHPIDALLERGRAAHIVFVGRRTDRPGTTSELLVRRHEGHALLVPEDAPLPQRVVAGYAGKALGARALRLAAELARTLGAPLRVLTVEDDPARRAAVQDTARAALADQGPEPDFVGADGEPVEGILAAVDANDLLVLAPHGRSRLGRLLLGSVAEEVVLRARCPVALTSKHPPSEST